MTLFHTFWARSWIIPVLATLLACQEQSTVQYRNQAHNANADASSARFPNELKLSNNGVESDAYDYTFATMNVGLKDATGKAIVSGALKARRFAYFPSNQTLSESQVGTLKELCRDISISEDPKSIKDLTAVPESGTMFLHWRAYHSLAVKESLASILLKAPAPILCLLRISISEDGKELTHYIAFDPIPDEKVPYSGTKYLTEATAEGLMLQTNQLVDDKKLVFKDSYLYEIEGDAVPLLRISALRNDRISVSANDSLASACRMHVTTAGTKLGNPKEMQRLSYAVESSQGLILRKVTSLSTSGVGIQLCAETQLREEDKSLKIEMDCESYLKIQESDGKEASCRWQVEWANQGDPSNTVAVAVNMNRVKVETIDVRTTAGAMKVLPLAANNPVRDKKTEMLGFSEVQLSQMEKSFDLWIAITPAAFKTIFEGFVSKINYLGFKADCQQDAFSAYVNYPIPEINWCEAGYMTAEQTAAQVAPTHILGIAATIFHEGLHTRGKDHDVSVPTYPPCTGSAASAQLAYDTIVSCKEDYCVPLRDSARLLYISELDYSLFNDPRRFQGQCQIWNRGLGLTPANFRAPL